MATGATPPKQDPYIVDAPQEIDIACADHFVAQVRRALMSGARRLCVDLSQTTFIDASGVHALIAIRDTAAAYECPLSLVAPEGPVRRILDLTRTRERVGPLHDDRPSALAA